MFSHDSYRPNDLRSKQRWARDQQRWALDQLDQLAKVQAMFSHDSLVEVTKPHYAGDLVNAKDAFAALTVTEALEALRIFCLDRLEQLTPNPGCDRLAQGVRELEAMGIARLYFLLRNCPDWVGLFAKRLGSLTEGQAPMCFGPSNKKAFNAITHLLRVIEAGNWPPPLEAFSQLVVLVGKALLPDMAEPGKAAGDSETKGAGKILNKGGRPKIALSKGMFYDAVEKDRERGRWTQKQWGIFFNCSHQTIGRSPGWKGLKKRQGKTSRSVVQATGEDESASTEDDDD